MEITSIGETTRGELLVADSGNGSILEVAGQGFETVARRTGNRSLVPRSQLEDHDGNVWIGGYGQGLLRLRGEKVDEFTRRDGLSSDFIGALLEDREGDLWSERPAGSIAFAIPRSSIFRPPTAVRATPSRPFAAATMGPPGWEPWEAA